MSLWWGWVPILSHKVLNCRPEKQGFKLGGLTVDQAKALRPFTPIDQRKKYWIREKEVNSDDTQFSRRERIKKIFNKQKNAHSIITVILEACEVPRPAYAIVWGTKRGRRPLFCAKVFAFDVDTGIFSYRVSYAGGTPGQKNLAIQIFRIIRDVYHRHVWTRSGDISIFPVMASNAKNAAERIWDEHYGERIIIKRHHEVNERLDSLRFGSTPRSWLDAFRVCSTALGELSYAKAMARLNNLGERREKAAEWAKESLSDLLELLEQEHSIRRDHGVAVLVFTILATMSGTYYIIKQIINAWPKIITPIPWLQDSENPSFWLALLFSAVCLATIYCFKGRNLRRGRKVLSPNHY